jgi:hypothetical protein
MKANNAKQLIWIGCAIAICVSIILFFYKNVKDYTDDKCMAIRREIEYRFQDIKENLNELTSQLSKIDEKISKK